MTQNRKMDQHCTHHQLLWKGMCTATAYPCPRYKIHSIKVHHYHALIEEALLLNKIQ